MKQIFVKNGRIVIEDVPIPALNESEVLVANVFSAISVGTEREIIRSSKKTSILNALKSSDLRKKAVEHLLKYGVSKATETAREYVRSMRTLGYSSSGYVLAIGRKIVDVNVGDRVACAGSEANHAEVVAIPRNLVAKIPEEVNFEEAAFTALGAIAMQGIRRANLQLGETIIIYGVGLLGQIGVQVAKAAGLSVIAIDVNEERVKLAEQIGADLNLVAGKHDLEKEVSCYTEDCGADAVVIYADTLSSEPVNQAMRMIRDKGKVVVVGSVGMYLNRHPFYEKEADFLISRSYGPGRYDSIYEEKGIDYPIGYVRWTENRNMQAFLNLLKSKKVNVNPLIGAVFPVEDAEKAYDQLISCEKNLLGILIKYDSSKYIPATEKIILPKRTLDINPRDVKGKINIAVIGAGSFAREILLPFVLKIPDYNLRAVVAASGNSAKRTSIEYKAEYCTSDYREVLKDKNIDLVIITTPHSLHYPIIMDAAKAGKAIYVEKPMCLTKEELIDVVEVIKEMKVPLVVGFNRRYSPLSVKAKELLKEKHRPYLINYRVKAGFMPRSNWIQDPEVGGGRIVGECCHFFDLFNYIIESDVERIKVENIPINNTTVVANDNISVTMRWKDGSLTVLTYTSLGHVDLPKERIEIFASGSAIVIDDFKEMHLYGFHETGINLKKQDKGHYQQLVELSKFLKGEKSNIISFEDCVKSTKISFTVEDMLRASKFNVQ